MNDGSLLAYLIYLLLSLVLIFWASTRSTSSAISPPTEKMPLNPANFPRPPLLERVSRHLVVKWPSGQVIADTKNAFWVLETHHPPSMSYPLFLLSTGLITLFSAYYIPPSDVVIPLTKTPRSTYCEWKGRATYFSVPAPEDRSSKAVENRAWCYESPTPGFKDIKDYVSFYAGPWDCYVDGEKVEAQPGDFYGGWKTSDIVGKIKGAPGTLGW